MADQSKRQRLDKMTGVPKTLMGAMKQVPVIDLKYYPGNARRGDIESVAESLSYHGQFKPIVVQKSTNYVLAGNHTLQAAKEVLGWKDISVVFVDVDDEQAAKIVLVDNATSDKGTYDYDALMDIIQSVNDPIGTGYTQELIDNMNALLDGIATGEGIYDNGGKIDKEHLGRSAFAEDDDPVDVDEFDDLPSIMSGVKSLKPDAVFMSEDWYGIPDLLEEMLYPRIDTYVDTWSGPTSSSDDGSSLFMYSYGTDSTKGMPWDRTILNFYTSDSRFENWWADPSKYTAKMLNAGVSGSVSHDFSLFAGLPRVLHIFNVYRSRWLSRYMQEAGIRIIPSITFSDMSSLEFSLTGIPVGAPVVCIQMQTIDDAKEKDDRGYRIRTSCIAEAIETLRPEQLMVYGNKPGFDMIQEMDLDVELIFVDNRASRRSQWQKERDRAVYKDAATRKKSARVTGISQTGVAMRGY